MLRNPSKTDLILLGSLFLCELSLTVIAMMIYRKGERPFGVFVFSKPGVAFFVAIALSLIVGTVVILKYIASTRSQSRHFQLIVMMNFVTVVVVLLIGEGTLRLSSRSSKEGETLFGTVLTPKNWDKLTLHYWRRLEKASDSRSCEVYDDLMGWTNGPNRQCSHGMYWISSEGIRAPHAGHSFADVPAKPRIALVGNSYTFALDVSYEDSWGYLLERALQSRFQVLNFGVGGYGIHQAYLRYEKDVRGWKPDIVIFGFISHDLNRTMTVYPFLSFFGWGPFSSPRFVLRNGELTLLNVPPVSPETILSHRTISALPFIEYDSGYKESEWEKGPYQFSYLLRLFVSWFPRWSAVSPDVSDEAFVAVNAAILRSFVSSATQAGSIPIVVYFPHGEVKDGARARSSEPIHEQVLRAAQIHYTDLTPCLLELNATDRFVSDSDGGHYSPQGNARVASCLRNIVDEVLTR